MRVKKDVRPVDCVLFKIFIVLFNSFSIDNNDNNLKKKGLFPCNYPEQDIDVGAGGCWKWTNRQSSLKQHEMGHVFKQPYCFGP